MTIAFNANGDTTLDDHLVRNVDDVNYIGVIINNKDRPTRKYACPKGIDLLICNRENWAPTSLFAAKSNVTIIDPSNDYALKY